MSAYFRAKSLVSMEARFEERNVARHGFDFFDDLGWQEASGGRIFVRAGNFGEYAEQLSCGALVVLPDLCCWTGGTEPGVCRRHGFAEAASAVVCE